MNFILCVLLPSALGLKLLSKFSNANKLTDLILYYLILVLFSSLLMGLTIIFINNFDENIILYLENHYKFFIKYMLLSILINIVLSFVISIFIKFIDFKLEVKHETKKNSKNN